MRRDLARFAVLSVIAVVLAMCRPASIGLPRVPIHSVSPDGSWVAEVRNHPSIDPPRQSLWLGPVDQPLLKVQNLAPDRESCRRVVWAADGSAVSFLLRPEGAVEVRITK